MAWVWFWLLLINLIMSLLLKKILKWIGLGLGTFFLSLVLFFYWGRPPVAQEIKWGVSFSSKHAYYLGLDWQEAYLALLDDLGVKSIRIITHWEWLEPQKDEYDFEDIDWQVEEAQKRGVEVVLVVGMKTPRWPECHLPDWAKTLNKEEQQKEILALVEQSINHFKGFSAIKIWQVENEPFFAYGDCPWADKEFVKKEVALVRSLDDRPVMITESGEFTPWFNAAQIGDIVGTTLYRKVWVEEFNRYFTYPLRSVFYWRKARITQKFFDKKVICAELQAEPWGPVLTYDLLIEEQKKTMDLKQFKEMVVYARNTGLDEFYFWGAEWWYWLRVNQNDSGIWDYARNLF